MQVAWSRATGPVAPHGPSSRPWRWLLRVHPPPCFGARMKLSNRRRSRRTASSCWRPLQGFRRTGSSSAGTGVGPMIVLPPSCEHARPVASTGPRISSCTNDGEYGWVGRLLASVSGYVRTDVRETTREPVRVRPPATRRRSRRRPMDRADPLESDRRWKHRST